MEGVLNSASDYKAHKKMEGSFDEEREMIKEPLLKNSPKGGIRTMPFIFGKFQITISCLN